MSATEIDGEYSSYAADTSTQLESQSLGSVSQRTLDKLTVLPDKEQVLYERHMHWLVTQQQNVASAQHQNPSQRMDVLQTNQIHLSNVDAPSAETQAAEQWTLTPTTRNKRRSTSSKSRGSSFCRKLVCVLLFMAVVGAFCALVLFLNKVDHHPANPYTATATAITLINTATITYPQPAGYFGQFCNWTFRPERSKRSQDNARSSTHSDRSWLATDDTGTGLLYADNSRSFDLAVNSPTSNNGRNALSEENNGKRPESQAPTESDSIHFNAGNSGGRLLTSNGNSFFGRDGAGRSYVSNGSRVTDGTYQFTVWLQSVKGGRCTGSLISDRHVLSAAHCVTEGNRRSEGLHDTDLMPDVKFPPSIHLGLTSGPHTHTPHRVQVYPDAVYLHSDYDKEFSHRDIALIHLNDTVRFNEYVRPTCLAAPDDRLPETCSIFGYGLQGLDKNVNFTLNRASGMRTVTSTTCIKDLMERILHDYFTFRNSTRTEDKNREKTHYFTVRLRDKLCQIVDENGKSVCGGDSGGPVMCTPVGVVSSPAYHDPSSPLFHKSDPSLKQFGVNSGLISGFTCGTPNTTSLHTSVQAHWTWLELVARPALENYLRDKGRHKAWFRSCQQTVDWEDVKKRLVAKQYALIDAFKDNLCRKWVAYRTCLDHTSSEQRHLCDEMDITKLEHMHTELEVDFLPYFQNLSRAGI